MHLSFIPTVTLGLILWGRDILRQETVRGDLKRDFKVIYHIQILLGFDITGLSHCHHGRHTSRDCFFQ